MHTSMSEKKATYELNICREHTGKQSNFIKLCDRHLQLNSLIYIAFAFHELKRLLIPPYFIFYYFFNLYRQPIWHIHLSNTGRIPFADLILQKVNFWEWKELCMSFVFKMLIIAFFPVSSLSIVLAKEFILLL